MTVSMDGDPTATVKKHKPFHKSSSKKQENAKANETTVATNVPKSAEKNVVKQPKSIFYEPKVFDKRPDFSWTIKTNTTNPKTLAVMKCKVLSLDRYPRNKATHHCVQGTGKEAFGVTIGAGVLIGPDGQDILTKLINDGKKLEEPRYFDSKSISPNAIVEIKANVCSLGKKDPWGKTPFEISGDVKLEGVYNHGYTMQKEYIDEELDQAPPLNNISFNGFAGATLTWSPNKLTKVSAAVGEKFSNKAKSVPALKLKFETSIIPNKNSAFARVEVITTPSGTAVEVGGIIKIPNKMQKN